MPHRAAYSPSDGFLKLVVLPLGVVARLFVINRHFEGSMTEKSPMTTGDFSMLSK
ncbi:MAG: hypothetical protein ABJH05_01745 [Fulvivirga sp.]